ncbi:MAG: hypothetical protein RDU20_17515 [Desulfomonilaceae bacterium]|nr:hypothetical protein [Desulfomonilaceae bacterium]
MNGTIRDLPIHCSTLDFGRPELSEEETSFYRRFGEEIVSLCRSAPKSVQTVSMLFLMEYSGVRLGEQPDFFANYYPPAWSILYRLSHEHDLPPERLNEADVTHAITGHAMAMFLHSLDDHLVDGQVSLTPLTLLLRSQAWTIMNRAFGRLAEGVPRGEETVRRFIDAYYSGVQDSEEPNSLDDYCDLFRKQMATWMIAPILLSTRLSGTSDFTRDIELAYGSFGIAWRLLDDVRDICEDMEKAARSSVYVCLPERLKTHWNQSAARNRNGNRDSANAVLTHILEHGVVDTIIRRICTELDAAASIVDAHKMTGLAREFRCLAEPLGTSGNT